MSNKVKMIIDAILGAAFSVAALALLVFSSMIWVMPVPDASLAETILVKLIPTGLFILAAVATVIFVRRFLKLFMAK